MSTVACDKMFLLLSKGTIPEIYNLDQDLKGRLMYIDLFQGSVLEGRAVNYGQLIVSLVS